MAQAVEEMCMAVDNYPDEHTKFFPRKGSHMWKLGIIFFENFKKRKVLVEGKSIARFVDAEGRMRP